MQILIRNVKEGHCGYCQKSVSEALIPSMDFSAMVEVESNCAKVEFSKDVPKAD